MSFRRYDDCICNPNAMDENKRDCQVHRQTNIATGIDITEFYHRGQ